MWQLSEHSMLNFLEFSSALLNDSMKKSWKNYFTAIVNEVSIILWFRNNTITKVLRNNSGEVIIFIFCFPRKSGGFCLKFLLSENFMNKKISFHYFLLLQSPWTIELLFAIEMSTGARKPLINLRTIELNSF